MLIVLDLETVWGKDFSLTKLTYEQYIKHPRFAVHCAGIKVNTAETYVVWGPQYEGGECIGAHLQGLIDHAHALNEEVTVVCHNAA